MKYFLVDNHDISKRCFLNLFDKNIVPSAKLPLETHNQLIEISADKTLRPDFSLMQSMVALKSNTAIFFPHLENNLIMCVFNVDPSIEKQVKKKTEPTL